MTSTSLTSCGLFLSLCLLMTRPALAQNPSVTQVSVTEGEAVIDPTRLANQTQTSAKYSGATPNTPESGVSTSNSGGDPDDEDVPPVGGTRCQGYYDVMGQWDPPFNCNAGVFLYCCGTCFYRFCCQFRQQRLDQSICNNYDTPIWANTGKPVATITEGGADQDRDRTHLIVYIICGVVAIMVLVGIFTKLGLEKSRGGSGGAVAGAQGDLNTRTLTDLLKQQSGGAEVHTAENSSTGPDTSERPNGTRVLRSRSEQYHLNNSPFGAGLPHTQSNHSAGGLNTYTSLKAVADSASHKYYKSYPLMDFSQHQSNDTPRLPHPPHPHSPAHLDHARPQPDSSAFKAWEPGTRHVQRQTSAPGHSTTPLHNPNRRHTYSTRRQQSTEDLPDLFSHPYGALYQAASGQGRLLQGGPSAAQPPHPLYSRPKSFSTHSATEVTV